MILNLESKASLSPVLNLQSAAPMVVLDLTDSVKSPVLDMQATHWPEPLASESIALIGTQLLVAVLLIGVSGGASWVFRSQLANLLLNVTQTNEDQQTKNPAQRAKPQSPSSNIQVQPPFPAPAAPFHPGREPSAPTVKFTQPVNGWVKQQDIDLWIKPSPPYGSPPQTLEAKGSSLLYKGDSFKTKAKKRVPVYDAPDTGGSVAFYLEPGQIAEIYEAYEKTIKPGLVRFQKDWKDPETGVVYRAGEVVNFYTYQEGGCYWFMFSQHSHGQLGDGYCPPYIEGTTAVQEDESIKFNHIKTLASDKRDGWIEVKHLPEGEEAFEDLSLEEQQQSQEQSPEAANLPAPQMQVGDRYVSESINHNNPKLNNITERTVIAVSSNGDFTLTSRNQKSGFTRTIEYTGQWNVKSTRGSTGEGSIYSPPVAYFDFPLYPGKQWSRPSVETNSKTGAFRAQNVDGKVGGWEQVSVPAGTFRALRITLNTKVHDIVAGTITEAEDISWYVPEVKRTVKSEMTTKSNTGVPERQTLQLLEYHVR